MKKISYFISMLCILALASCSSDTDDIINGNKPVNTEKLIVNVSMPGQDTRLSTEDLVNLKWETNDVIIAEGYDTDAWGGKCLGKTQLTLSSIGSNSNVASFSGNAIQGANFYKYFYRGSENVEESKWGGYTISIPSIVQEQLEPNSSKHIKDCMYLASDKLPLASKNVQLNHTSSVIRLNVKSLPESIKNADDFEFVYQYKSYSQTSPSTQAKLHYKGKLDQKNNYLYFCIPSAFALSTWDNEGLIIDIKAAGKNVTAKVTPRNDFSYDYGKVYTITLDYDNPGTWVWDLHQPVTYIFKPDFTAGNNLFTLATDPWTQETTPDKFDKLYACINSNGIPTLEFNAHERSVPKTVDANNVEIEDGEIIDSRVITPNITLTENNLLSFKFKIWNIQDVKTVDQNFKLAIRTLQQDGTWSDWQNDLVMKYPEGLGSEVVNKISIPAKYNNTTVQLSFWVHSEPWKFVASWNPNYKEYKRGVFYYIYDLNIK